MEKYFVISNNLENHSYMISCNLVKKFLARYCIFHLYMTSNNPFKKALGWMLYFIHYMISNNPVKGSWLDIVLSFICDYYMLQNITL